MASCFAAPHAHAKILSIDCARALALPGVRAVVTAADMPEVSAEFTDQAEGAMVNYGFYSRNVIAREKALYRGHVIAAVAATDPAAAEQALGPDSKSSTKSCPPSSPPRTP